MSDQRKFGCVIICICLIAQLSGCGGTSSEKLPAQTSASSTQNLPPTQAAVANTVPVTVTNSIYGEVNTPYISVTLCSPGSVTNCQTIDHILLDTGSAGLRVYAVALNASLQLSPVTDVNGNPLAECMQFSEGYMWGPVRRANLKMAGELVNNLAIQVVSDHSFSSMPDSCSATGQSLNTPQTFGANGVFGVGVFRQDCGSYCTQLNNIYFACTSQNCQSSALDINSQIQNPVSQFSSDNNGTIVSFDSMINGSAANSLTGTLTFGIDTQANNVSTNSHTLTADPTTGYITTTVLGQNYASSFFDTGSNAILFNPPGYSLPMCANAPWYFCPATTTSFSAVSKGLNNVSAPIEFSAANAILLFQTNPDFSAYPDLVGPVSGNDTFDWGMPFFFGRKVYTAIEGGTTTAGVGPYSGW